MKKFLLVLVFSFFFLYGFSNAQYIHDVVARAYTSKLTIHYDPNDFMPNNSIRRDEAAKFFVNFAKSVGKAAYTVNANECQFFDLDDAWEDLRDTVVESCRIGIFRGSNGRFYPGGSLTNAETIAALMRIVDGNQLEN